MQHMQHDRQANQPRVLDEVALRQIVTNLGTLIDMLA